MSGTIFAFMVHFCLCSNDDAALEARVLSEMDVNPNSNLLLADALRCQQQYGLPLMNGWSSEFATKVRDYCWDTFMQRYRHKEFNGLMMAQIMPERECKARNLI